MLTSGGTSTGMSTWTCSEACEDELEVLLPNSGSSSMYDWNLLEGGEWDRDEGPPFEPFTGRGCMDHSVKSLSGLW